MRCFSGASKACGNFVDFSTVSGHEPQPPAKCGMDLVALFNKPTSEAAVYDCVWALVLRCRLPAPRGRPPRKGAAILFPQIEMGARYL